MTYIAAVHRDKDVVLIADAAVTTSSPRLRADYTYFEQLQKQDGSKAVDEAAMKIFQLSEDELCVFAGDVDVGLSVIKFLNENSAGELNERLQVMSNSLGTFDKNIQMLLAGTNDSGGYLLAWSSVSPMHIETVPVGGYVSFGSGKKILDKALLSLVSNWCTCPVEDFMVILSSGMQVASQHQNAIAENIGGMYSVASITGGSVTWMSDASFLTYAPSNFKNIHSPFLNVVSSFMRNGWQILCTRSPDLKAKVSEDVNNDGVSGLSIKILSTILNCDDEMLDIFIQEISGLTNKLSSDYYVFLSRKEPRAVIVQSHNKMMSGEKVKANVTNGKLNLEMQPDFLEYLLPKESVGTIVSPAIVLVLSSDIKNN